MKTIPLTQGKVALVDDDCYTELMKFRWRAQKRVTKKRTYYYAFCNATPLKSRMVPISMHRLVASISGKIEVDHINGDGLDNRKCNLRAATHAQNMYNRRKESGTSSRFKGVNLYKGKWIACIGAGKTRKYLGYHSSEIEAAKAYDREAKLRFKEFALLNNA